MMIGRSIENYEILEKINCPENLEIYKAVDVSVNRNVFIKFVGRDDLRRPKIVEKLRSEAATLTKLTHSCIPTLYSLKEIDGEIFMISEFAEGETLDRVLLLEGKFSIKKAVPIFAQVFDCLEYTHKIGIAHNALKISKIMLTDVGNVKVLGFGTSEFVSSETGEQKDIYALAAMLYETLSGKSLFDAEKEFESSIPESIEAVIGQALSPNAAETFQTVAEFRNALEIAGFTVSVENTSNEFQKTSEDLVEKTDPGSSDEKVFSVCAVDFSQTENKFLEKDFNLNTAQSKELDNSSGKTQQRRYKVAGAAICAMIVLHFFWQFSFIQSEKLRTAETAIKESMPEKTVMESEKDQPRIELEKDESIQSVDELKNSGDINSEKAIQPSDDTQAETKSAPTDSKKKTTPESKNERLRRAEKLLTGF
jgi:serine/threonine protein kinase